MHMMGWGHASDLLTYSLTSYLLTSASAVGGLRTGVTLSTHRPHASGPSAYSLVVTCLRVRVGVGVLGLGLGVRG